MQCVNGNCEDGTCLCEEGWRGPLCDHRDIAGEYVLKRYLLEDCPEYFSTDISGSGTSQELCGKADIYDVCYEFWIRLQSDGGFSRKFKFSEVFSDGSREIYYDNNISGKWQFVDNGNSVRLTNSATNGFWTLEIENNGDLVSYTNERDGGPNCYQTEIYQKQ